MKDTQRAARELIGQGLTVVPMLEKRPLWRSFPHSPRSDEERRRLDISTVFDLNRVFAHAGRRQLNIAVLDVAQADADNQAAVDLLGELGVNGSQKSWIIRTRRGWRILYRVPERERELLRNAIKNGDPEGGVDLDLLINSPALVPPSVHPSGFAYQWAPGHSPHEVPFAELQEPPGLLVSHWENICNRTRSGTKQPVLIQQHPDFERAVLRFLGGLGETPAVKSNGWTQDTRCPYPGHDKHAQKRFAVNFQLGVWRCWTRHESGSLLKLARDFGIDAPVTERSRTEGIAVGSR